MADSLLRFEVGEMGRVGEKAQDSACRISEETKMRIDGLGAAVTGKSTISNVVKPSESGFGETIKNAITGVNELQTEADELAKKLASGDAVDIHEAMIAMQKASMALQFTVQVRNKIIEAYQEIMKMQV